ncbi:MAG: TfoX/Sxy family protein [Acidobacteriota bacterium]
MAASKEYLAFLSEHLAPLGTLTSRPMMGGHCLYLNDVIFALVANNTLYLKVDAETRPKFTAGGLAAFQPFPEKGGGMSYHLAPPEFFDNQDAALEWGRMAVEAGQRAQAKRKPKGKKRAER